MSNATKIDVYLKNPNGTPLTNTRFIIKPVRAGFWSSIVGVVEDKEIIYSTDLDGYVQMELMPLPYPYVLTYSYSDDAIPGHFLFYVPEIDSVVNLQDLIVTRADSSDKYTDNVLAQIIAAKVATLAAAAQAAISEENAEESALKAAEAEATSTTNAATTTSDRNQVALTNQQLIDIYMSLQKATVVIQGIALRNELTLGTSTLWVDSVGKLRIMNGTPTDKDSDGVIVGTQS